jgi:hypothetical protein
MSGSSHRRSLESAQQFGFLRRELSVREGQIRALVVKSIYFRIDATAEKACAFRRH